MDSAVEEGAVAFVAVPLAEAERVQAGSVVVGVAAGPVVDSVAAAVPGPVGLAEVVKVGLEVLAEVVG
ncbi:MAG: hypothetical protein JWN70_2066 [Planctomycetaceae bacterium]|nr:hypothetical protein [Planctomycetaceae bacterium]